MSKSTGILNPEVGDAPVPSFDSVLSWSAELGLPELESLLRAMERIAQDSGDSEVTKRILEKLRNLRMLADIAGRDRPVLQGVEAISLHILVLLSQYLPDRSMMFRAALRRITEPDYQGISPDEARAWLVRAASVFSYPPGLVDHIREMVEGEADGVSITAALRAAVPNQVVAAHVQYVTQPEESQRLQLMDTALHMWQLSIRFDRSPMPLGTAGGVLWALGEVLEGVDGVAANLDSIGNGSVWASIRMYASSIWRLDDVVQILERTFDKIAHRLDERDTDSDKQTSQPIESDTIESRSSEELTLLQLEIERKRLEIAKMKVEHFEKVSDLLADRLLEVDSVEFSIENYPIFQMIERRIVVRNPIKRIRDEEIKSPGSMGQGNADVQV